MVDITSLTSEIQHSMIMFVSLLAALAVGRVLIQGILCSLGVFDWAAGILATSVVFVVGLMIIMHQSGMVVMTPANTITDVLMQSTQSFSTLTSLM